MLEQLLSKEVTDVSARIPHSVEELMKVIEDKDKIIEEQAKRIKELESLLASKE